LEEIPVTPMRLHQAFIKLTRLVPSRAIKENLKLNTTYGTTRYPAVGAKTISWFHSLYNKMVTLHEHTKVPVTSAIVWFSNHCHVVRTAMLSLTIVISKL
jgi:hypothetical protein